MNNCKKNYFDSGNLKLSWTEWGSDNSEVIILLHGPRECALSWGIVAEYLASQYRVVALDNRGHGFSQDAEPDAYKFPNYVKDLGNLINIICIDDITIVGHSMGGLYAIDYLANIGSKVSKFIALDVVLSWEDSVEQLPPSYEGRECRVDPESTQSCDIPEMWGFWEAIKIPTLLMTGRQSEFLTHETAVEMRERLPGCYLAELEGGGHWFHHESPGSFHAAVSWFLEMGRQ